MISAIKAKVALNQKKYPVDICDGSMEYSHETKITETSGQILTPDIVALNQKKYPVDLCYGSMEYSHETKITETSGETLTPDIALKDGHYNTEKTLISEYCTVLLTILKFSEDRGWESKDNPRNLCLALGSELGKLYKIFLWDDECDYQGGVDKDKLITDENGYILSVRKKRRVEMAISDDKWNKAAQELAEVMIYMMKLDYALHPRDIDDLEEIVDLLQKKQIKKTDLRVISMRPLLI
jgi:hypothetical protein